MVFQRDATPRLNLNELLRNLVKYNSKEFSKCFFFSAEGFLAAIFTPIPEDRNCLE